MKKTLFALACICAASFTTFAQVGIGTTTPNTDAALEVLSTTKGILLPRVALTGTTIASPLSLHVAGMTVYNTATVLDVTPGYYYNDGLKWVKIADANNNDLRTAQDFPTSHITKDAGVGGLGINAGSADVIAIGFEAGYSNPYTDDFFKNIFIGTRSGYSNTDGYWNTFIGYKSGEGNTEGIKSTFIGHEAGSKNAYGNENTGIGYNALKNNVGDPTATTGNPPSGISNTAVGSESMLNNESGQGNVAVGVLSLWNNDDGDNNIAIGLRTLGVNTSGFDNTAIGFRSLASNSTGDNNTATGKWALRFNQTGSNNTAIGHETGTTLGGDMGDNNIFVGASITELKTGLNNAVIIGANLTGLGALADNTIIIADGAGNQRIVVDENGDTDMNGKLEVSGKIQAVDVNFSGLPVAADDTAAGGLGLTEGDMYQTLAGELRIKLL